MTAFGSIIRARGASKAAPLLALRAFISLILACCCVHQANAQVTRLTPTNLKNLNTAKDEDDPCAYVSKDRNTHRLYYVSNEPGRPTLMVADVDKRGFWQHGKPIDGPDPDIDNRSPCLSDDGHDLYFAAKLVFKGQENKSTVPDNFEIVHAVKLTKTYQFSAPTPVLAVCTEADELHPWLTTDGKELFFSRKTKEGWRIFVAKRSENSGTFEAPRLIEEIPPGFQHATLTNEGRTMILQGPLANDRWGLFRSKRVRTGSALTWSPPEELINLNATPAEAPTGDLAPSLGRVDNRLYFVSDRAGGKGGRDIWTINAPAILSGTIRRK
jgi:hypothetical protein